MVPIPGGTFWVGTEREVYEREENPRYRARMTAFCIDALEVSTEEYEACMADGKCTEPHGGRRTCNTVAKGRANHPINCIDHEQATKVCARRGARLPTEAEWEYVARGGEEMRDYPWGSEPPDGKTCWKSALSCERGQFAEEAFGLHDVVGNVWEWTDSWFGSYPWPAQTGRHKVYRGGSWSRRFDKWMRPTLRNRMPPEDSGSHLGARCALTPKTVKCPGLVLSGGACAHRVFVGAQRRPACGGVWLPYHS
jgi:formylglycine-generating enzyme required for sulfatase activity